jgi:hypothetical protein
MIARALCVGAAMIALSGCATVFGGFSETLAIQTMSEGTDLAGAQCELSNSKGTWHVTTPGPVTIRRSHDDLDIHCAFARYASNFGHVPSSTRALVYGNILLPGALVATAVDIVGGSAFDYPPLITVKLHPAREASAPGTPSD